MSSYSTRECVRVEKPHEETEVTHITRLGQMVLMKRVNVGHICMYVYEVIRIFPQRTPGRVRGLAQRYLCGGDVKQQQTKR